MQATRDNLVAAALGLLREFPSVLGEWLDSSAPDSTHPKWEATVVDRVLDPTLLPDDDLRELLNDLVSLAEIDEPEIGGGPWLALMEARGAASDYAGYPEPAPSEMRDFQVGGRTVALPVLINPVVTVSTLPPGQTPDDDVLTRLVRESAGAAFPDEPIRPVTWPATPNTDKTS
jgi:hypothetical protein